MITNLRELNDKINKIANYVVKEACENTSSGNYIIDAEEICENCNIELDDYKKYIDFIKEELQSREELLDCSLTYSEVDVDCALDYCPNYEWERGDEIIFGSYENFENRNIIPIEIKRSISELLEIGEEVYKNHKDIVEDIELNKNIAFLEAGLTFFETSGDRVVFLKELGGDKYWSCDIYDNEFNFLYEKHLTEKQIAIEMFKGVFQNDPVAQNILLKIKLEELKAAKEKYPFDEKIQSAIDDYEKKLGIFERAVDTTNDFYTGKWRVHLVPSGGRYGLNNNLVNESNKILIEFYDVSQDKKIFPYGQLAGRYNVETIYNNWEEEYEHGLCLDTSIPAWTLTGDEMLDVIVWLDREFFKENIIEDLGLKVYTFKQLKSVGIDTIKDLLSKSEEEIKNIPNIGKTQYKEILDKINSFGYKFSPNKKENRHPKLNSLISGAEQRTSHNSYVKGPRENLEK